MIAQPKHLFLAGCVLIIAAYFGEWVILFARIAGAILIFLAVAHKARPKAEEIVSSLAGKFASSRIPETTWAGSTIEGGIVTPSRAKSRRRG